ncbi:MAG: terminase TerL endonuclease subunit, partial [Gemmataceae bacterium]
VLKAQGIPAKANIVRRLNFCEWTESVTAWLPMEAWDACGAPIDPDALKGRSCFAGLDLSSTTDVSALVLLFPRGNGYDALPFFWVPAEGIRKRSERDHVPYDVWKRQGLIFASEGNVVDYEAIRQKLVELREGYDIREIAVDRWNSTGLQTQLMGDGFAVVQFGQGFASMTAPAKELEKLVLEGAINHGGNPVLRWMASNAVVALDAAGNIKPAKDKSTEKIDGIVALIMALGRAMVAANATPYGDGRGLLMI